jgi:Dolichyl-phosphate-mannose-protein mannosyltransferase
VAPISDCRARIWLAIIILVALVIRLAWALHQPSDDAAIDRLPDQREYLQLGKNILSAGELWMIDPRFGQAVYAYRTPGYPLLVACCGARPVVVRGVQSVIDAWTVLAIFLLARRWLSPGGAVLAAAIVAINPYMIFFTGLILSETLFTAMLCWGLALLILSDGPWPDGGKLLAWLGGAALLALAVLVRPGAILMPVVLGCAAALANRTTLVRAAQRPWPLPVGATMLLVTVLATFPWAARNRWVLGSWIWTATDDGITRYDGFNPDATGASNQSFVDFMPWTQDMTEIARSRYFTQLADEWIDEHPFQSLRLAGVKIARTWSPMPLSQEYGSKLLYEIIGIGYGVALDLLVLVGLWQEILPGAAKRALLLPAVYFTIAAALSVGSLRYRIPAEGPMAIIAASSICRARVQSNT